MAMNPIIKFTTLFGLLAVELAVTLTAERGTGSASCWPRIFFVISMVFVLALVLRHAHPVGQRGHSGGREALGAHEEGGWPWTGRAYSDPCWRS